MNNEEIKDYLLKNDDGQALWAEMTKGIRAKKDELLNETKRVKSELNILQEEYSSIKNSWIAEKEERRQTALDEGINSAFTRANIIPDEFDNVRAIMGRDGDFSLDDDNGLISLGETPLDDYIKEFSKSETGKRFTLAGYNTGGGARGGASRAGRNLDLEGMSSKEILDAIRNNKITN